MNLFFVLVSSVLCGVSSQVLSGGAPSGIVDRVQRRVPVPLYHLSLGSVGDQFGFPVRPLEDVDGDGHPELIVGAQGGDNETGSIYVFSGRRGELLYVTHGVSPGDRFGHSASALGDIDGDGLSDFVVGAPGDDTPIGPDTGSIWLCSGATGAVIRVVGGSFPGKEFGSSVAGLDDIDGDGTPDVLVGAPHDVAPFPAGLAIVVSGANGSTLRSHLGSSPGDLHGYACSVLGDIDMDGVREYAICAPEDDDAGPDAGAVGIYQGATGIRLCKLLGSSGGGHYFGTSVAAVGDIDSDSVEETLIGWAEANPNGVDSGSAVVFTGCNPTPLLFLEGSMPGDGFGNAVAGTGDVDGDGVPDLIVGAPEATRFGVESGLARIHSGAGGDTLFTFFGAGSATLLGASVCSLGDLDGDGAPDVAIGAPGDQNGISPGRVFVFPGG